MRSMPSNHHLKRVRRSNADACRAVPVMCAFARLPADESCKKIQPRPNARKHAARFSDCTIARTTHSCKTVSALCIQSIIAS